MDREAVVSFRNVSKSFGDLVVLDSINFSLLKGETVVVIGPSGSGKSTLLRVINGLEGIDNGEVELLGLSVHRTRSRRALAGKAGMVFQSHNLFPHMTAEENVAIGLREVRGIAKSAALGRAREELERVGLREKAKSYPRQLSGGQQQRVGIARALAMEPEVMLLDEPTASLDPELIGEVLEVLLQLGRGGMTMLIVSHELGFVEAAAQRVVMFDHGRIIEEGSPNQLIHSPQQKRTADFLQRFRFQGAMT